MTDLDYIIKDKYSGDSTKVSVEDHSRIESGEPLAYIIGWIPFLDLRIDLSLRPLIPRIETEFWVDQVIKESTHKYGKNAKLRILDTFSGSGCIGLSFAEAFPDSLVVFSDIDENCLNQIEINAKLNNLSNIEIVHSDVFAGIEGDFDIITANPPYINFATKLDSSVINFEPHHALFAKDRGLAFYKKISHTLKAFLTNSGEMFIEFGISQESDITTLFGEKEFQVETRRDQFGIIRYAKVSL